MFSVVKSLKTLEISTFLWYHKDMDDQRITAEELSKMPREMVEKLYLQLLDSFDFIKAQNEALLKNMSILQEKIDILTQQRFGRKTEKDLKVNDDQLAMDLAGINIFNEAEVLTEDNVPEEPDFIEVVVKRRRPKGKRESDLSRLEKVVEPLIEIDEDKLKELFPGGYTRLSDYVYTDIEYIPAKAVAHEHHLAVYAGKHNEGVVRADMPERLLKNSLITPTLAAAVINAKYANALPLNRISEEFARNDLNLSRQVLAGWMIKLTQRYLGTVYRRMHQKILESKLIHCDETPFKMIHDGKESPNSKCYMWVYHTQERYGSPPIYLYEYQPGRDSDVLRKFLDGYEGILVTDGYQVYHTVAKERPNELKVAGCWVHARRKYAEITKSARAETLSSKTAKEAIKRIQAIYHVDNMTKGKSKEEILDNRKQNVKPLVDSYFDWVKQCLDKPIDRGGHLYTALTYSLNQEQFLKTFLDDPMVPLDNNDAERSIRKFCVGKHSWHVIDSPNGAESSAILYSITETAKANGLKPYDYFVYLFNGILSHMDDSPNDYIDELLPWSEKIPDSVRQTI